MDTTGQNARLTGITSDKDVFDATESQAQESHSSDVDQVRIERNRIQRSILPASSPGNGQTNKRASATGNEGDRAIVAGFNSFRGANSRSGKTHSGADKNNARNGFVNDDSLHRQNSCRCHRLRNWEYQSLREG